MAATLELMGEDREKQSVVHKGVGSSPKCQFGNCGEWQDLNWTDCKEEKLNKIHAK